MLKIEYQEEINEKYLYMIDEEFNKFAVKNEIKCDYRDFCFVAKEDENVIGIITGNTIYKEVHISNLIVLEKYRNKYIGSKLIEKVQSFYKDKGFENINLTTYAFQAPEFYKKKGFRVEFIRENKENPKLNKYFLVKYF